MLMRITNLVFAAALICATSVSAQNPYGVPEFLPVACPGSFNGRTMAISGNGMVCLGDFSGSSNPSTLHGVLRDGTLLGPINTSLPPYFRALKRRPDGSLLAFGTAVVNGVGLFLSIDALSQEGETTGSYFYGLSGFYVNGVAISSADDVYVGSSSSEIFKVGPTGPEHYASGVGNNNFMELHADGSRIYIGSGNTLALTGPLQEVEVLHTFTPQAPNAQYATVSGIATDPLGGLFITVTDEGILSTIGSSLYYMDTNTEELFLMATYSGSMTTPVYDPVHQELYVLGNGNIELAPCSNNARTLYRWKLADCFGVIAGSAFLDNCNECVGGTTGVVACVAACTSVEFASSIEPITLVDFAGILKESCPQLNCDGGLVDYTGTTPGNGIAGQSYPIRVKGNSDGTRTDYITAFFDWDQDGEFETAVNIGTITNSSGTDEKEATSNIAIPVSALPGLTRMRVFKNYDAYPTDPCANYSFGQAEDYLINVSAPAPDFSINCFYGSCNSMITGCSGLVGPIATLGVNAMNGFNEPIAVSFSGAPSWLTYSTNSYAIEPPYPDEFNHIHGEATSGIVPGSYTYDIVLTSVPSGITHSFTTTTTFMAPIPVTCGGPYGPLSTTDSSIPLQASTPFGMWSGNGVDGERFYPAAAGAGTHTLMFTSNDPMQCFASCSTTITVNAPAGCTGNQVEVRITTDNNASQLSWEITNASNVVIASGAPIQNNSVVNETVCLGSTPTSACYGFRLMDSFGDGIANGGWELRTTDGKLLLRDDFAGGFASPALPAANPSYGSAHSFCLPAGPANIAPTECGIFNNLLGNKVYANKVIGAANYQFEFSDPDAGFFRRIARPYNYVLFGDMVTNPLVPGVKYFARVRTDRDGAMLDAHFGSGCEMGIGLAAVPCTQLIPAPAYGHSCNETRTFNTNNSFIYATPVQGATEYQFRIFSTQEGYDQTFTRSTYILQLKWNSSVAPPLINGYTYQVEMNVKVNSLYSGFCTSQCNITIDNSANRPEASLVQANGTATMWPNPVHDGQVNLNIDGLLDADQRITVEIQDIYGKLVFAKEFGNSGERFNTILNLSSDIASGVYMVNITVNGERTVQRLSIIR